MLYLSQELLTPTFITTCHIKNDYLETEEKQINLSVFYPVDGSTDSFCDLNTQKHLCAELGIWLSEEEHLLCKHKDSSSNLQLHIKKSSLAVHVCNHSIGGQVDPKSSLISWPSPKEQASIS